MSMKNNSAERLRSVVTVGNFDGVHRGHQALIKEARVRGKDLACDSVVLTFEPHPGFVLRGPRDRFLITPSAVKDFYLTRSGIDLVVTEPFTKDFAALEARDFLDHILANRMGASCVVVGYNFSFGRGGQGNVDTLAEWGRSRGVEVVVVPPYIDSHTGLTVSSSLIREYISQGDVETARGLLGHPMSVRAAVVSGAKRGREQEVPTLNLVPPREQVMPPYGVYAGFVCINGKRLKGVANWGVRPTFGGTDPVLEIHSIEALEGSHYGLLAQFDVLYHLREERRFDNGEALVAQIRRDVQQADRLLDQDDEGRNLPCENPV